MSSTSRLYYEAHITISAPNASLSGVERNMADAASWETFDAQTTMCGWRASRFEVDEVDHYDGAWFLSTRSRDLDNIKFSVHAMLVTLADLGYNPLRWKIEDTVLDSKHGDGVESLL